MSATDTKETSRISDQHRKVALAIQRFYNLPEDENIPEYLAISFPDQPVETDLTSATDQRDRALGLLERFKDYLAMMVYDTDTENDSELHCFSCGANQQEDHSPDCSINGLLAEYEALRKGER